MTAGCGPLAAPPLASSPESNQLRDLWFVFAEHQSRLATYTSSVDSELQRLADLWRRDTAFVSSVTELVAHPAYQLIISKGQQALPFLLRSLEQRPEQWFSALQTITGENPVAADDIGRVRKMAETWVRWGKQKKII